MTDTLPLEAAEALVVCGGMNRKPIDRYLPADDVHPVFVVTSSGARPCSFFDRYDPRTVTCLVPDPEGTGALFATEEELFHLPHGKETPEHFSLSAVDDIHELTLQGGHLYLANTAYDNIVDLEVEGRGRVIRHDFDRFREPRTEPGPDARSDTFHANQALVDPDGHLLTIVHHTAGRRNLTNTRRRLVRHGDGGVADLTAGEIYNFGWQAPHSLRPFDGAWMVADSGRHELVSLDRSWAVRAKWKVSGWPRGIAYDESERLAHVGVTATVKRYARIGDRAKTGVESIELATDRHWFLRFEQMEKIMWVMRCPSAYAEWLVSLPGED